MDAIVTRALHIIAEGAVNHFGSIKTARELIDAAKEADANSLKLQIIYNDETYLEGQYTYGAYNIDEVRKQRESSRLSNAEYERLFAYSKEVSLPITASVFGRRAADLLVKFDVPYIKIASGDLNNHRLLAHVAKMGRKLIVSTGMSSLDDVKAAVRVIERQHGVDYVLMHCIAIYPHAEEDAQLGYIETLKSTFPVEIGFSDHTLGTAAASAAVAMGVNWIEKHLTIARSRGGLDAKHSLEPGEFKDFVRALRGVAASLEVRDRRLSSAELHTRRRARRGLYAARDLTLGSKIREEDILVLRPEGQLSADSLLSLVGCECRRPIAHLEPFVAEDLS